MNRLPAELEVLSPIATKTDVLTAPAASPLTVTLPETKSDLATPTPPETNTAPDPFDVVSVVLLTLKEPVDVAFAVVKFPAVVLPVIIAVFNTLK